VRVAPGGERGVVLPTAALLASICAVVIAAIGFVISAHPDDGGPAATIGTPSASPTPTATAATTPSAHPVRRTPRVRKGDTYVEVYNNSNVKGLAGRTATRAQQAGWNVVGSDNWYGTVDASTVYYPARLHAAARLLAADLGVGRIRPAIAPMRLDRLTVILTGDHTD
jgi:hypothetical protein